MQVSLPSFEMLNLFKHFLDFLYGDLYSGEIDTLTGFALVASVQTCFVWQHAQVCRHGPKALSELLIMGRRSRAHPLATSFHVQEVITAEPLLRSTPSCLMVPLVNPGLFSCHFRERSGSGIALGLASRVASITSRPLWTLLPKRAPQRSSGVM